MDLFWLQKLAGALILPASLAAVLLLAGLLLLLFSRYRLTARVLLSGGVAVFFLFAGPGPTDRLLAGLENRYPPLVEVPEVAWVVVLGSGNAHSESRPATTLMGATGMARLGEGLRVLQHSPGARLLLTGGAVDGPRSHAEVAAAAAMELGVSEDRIVVDSRPRDTAGEAVRAREHAGDAPLVLVTSAAHMPRAMALFRARGLDPVPAPTAYLVRPERAFQPADILPSAQQLYRSERLLHEYVGMVWARVRGEL